MLIGQIILSIVLGATAALCAIMMGAAWWLAFLCYSGIGALNLICLAWWRLKHEDAPLRQS